MFSSNMKAPTILEVSCCQTFYRFKVDGECAHIPSGYTGTLILESTNQANPIRLSYPNVINYEPILATTEADFKNIIFTISSLKPDTEYKFDIWITQTPTGFLKFAKKSNKSELIFKTPTETFGCIHEPTTDIDLQCEEAKGKVYDGQCILPKFIVIGENGAGKSTFDNNLFFSIELKSIEARSRGNANNTNTNTTNTSNTDKTDPKLIKGTTGCVEYCTNNCRVMELQGPKSDEIRPDSYNIRILDLILRGHISSFPCEPEVKYKEFINGLGHVCVEGNAQLGSIEHHVTLEKQLYSEVVHGIIVVISLDSEINRDAGIKLYQLLNQTHPLIPKCIVASKLDILSGQSNNHNLDLTHGDIVKKLIYLAGACGIHPDHIYPGFPPLTAGQQVPDKIKYYYRKLINSALLRSRASTQETIITDFATYYLTVVHGKESKKIIITKDDYSNLNIIIGKIKKEFDIPYEFYLFQYRENTLREITSCNQLDFFFEVHTGREYLISDFNIEKEIKVRSTYQYLTTAISNVTKIEPEQLYLRVKKNGIFVKIEEITETFYETIYYENSEISKEIVFHVVCGSREVVVKMVYANESEGICDRKIFDLLQISDDFDKYHFVSSKGLKKVEVITFGDVERCDKTSRDGRVVLTLKKLGETNISTVKALVKYGNNIFPRSISYSDQSETLSVSSLLPNEMNVSNLCIKGKIIGTECIIDTIEFLLLCEEDTQGKQFKMLTIVKK